MCPQFHLIGLLPKKASAQVKIRINLLRHYDVVACPPLRENGRLLRSRSNFAQKLGVSMLSCISFSRC